MGIRTVTQELEAKLSSTSGGLFSKPSGKLERKSYKDGGERLKISIRNLKKTMDSTAIIMADGIEIAQIPIVDGAGRLDTEDLIALPVLEAGHAIEVSVDGISVLAGKLYVD